MARFRRHCYVPDCSGIGATAPRYKPNTRP
jgi:hypothetical protein